MFEFGYGCQTPRLQTLSILKLDQQVKVVVLSLKTTVVLMMALFCCSDHGYDDDDDEIDDGDGDDSDSDRGRGDDDGGHCALTKPDIDSDIDLWLQSGLAITDMLTIGLSY